MKSLVLIGTIVASIIILTTLLSILRNGRRGERRDHSGGGDSWPSDSLAPWDDVNGDDGGGDGGGD